MTAALSRPMSRAGVRILPTMSTTARSRTQSSRISRKKSTEKRTGLTPETRGVTEVSKVVAAVRGMASMGPMHSTMAHISSTDGTFPMREVTFSGLPCRRIANIASRARPMSAM